MSKFTPKAAQFERKSQIAPNALVFHREMSDASKLLILALNGIATCAPGWTPIQEDLRNRLGWGRDKMREAIKGAIEYGYLKVTQSRQIDDDCPNKKGTFSHNDFEHDIEGGYLKCKNSPMTENPSTDNPSPDNPALPNKEELTIKEEQQQHSHPPKNVVVVFPDKKEKEIVEDSEMKAKLKILRNYRLTTEFLETACTFSLFDIENAAKATQQYKESIIKKGELIESEAAIFRRALELCWKPSEQKEEKKDSSDLKEKNIAIAKEYKEIYEKEKNERAPFAFNHENPCNITCLYIDSFSKQGKRSTYTLSILDENFEKIISNFLQIKRNK